MQMEVACLLAQNHISVSTAMLPSAAPTTCADMFSSTQVRRLVKLFSYVTSKCDLGQYCAHMVFYIQYISSKLCRTVLNLADRNQAGYNFLIPFCEYFQHSTL